MKIIPVILCGGYGERLWPLSRREKPKQFLSLINDNSLLQNTLERINKFKDSEPPIIICNDEHRFLVSDQCQKVIGNNYKIILEPAKKNTAPAILASTLYSLKKRDSILIVLSSDHYIDNEKKFYNSILTARDHAQNDNIVTLGVKPYSANTNYGYINFTNNEIEGGYKVKSFVEKPSKTDAIKFLKSKNYFWNSGIFVFKASTMVELYKEFVPDMYKKILFSVQNATEDLDFFRLEKKSFNQSKNISFDYAILEKSSSKIVVPLRSDWKDLGSWNSIYEIRKKNSRHNVIHGEVENIESTGCLFFSPNTLTVGIGLKDLVIVNTPDASLVARKDRLDDLKIVLKNLKISNSDKLSNSLQFFRPWGWFEILMNSKTFKVKLIHIKPKKAISLQKHSKRSEHWVVVKGKANVIRGDEEFVLSKNESTFIKKNQIHRIKNQSSKVLEIIEVQSGEYLGEDDIIRYEDFYGRSKHLS